MHTAADKMMSASICVPFVLNELHHRFALEFFQLVIFAKERHEANVSVLKDISALVSIKVLADLTQQVDAVFNLVNLSDVNAVLRSF